MPHKPLTPSREISLLSITMMEHYILDNQDGVKQVLSVVEDKDKDAFYINLISLTSNMVAEQFKETDLLFGYLQMLRLDNDLEGVEVDREANVATAEYHRLAMALLYAVAINQPAIAEDICVFTPSNNLNKLADSLLNIVRPFVNTHMNKNDLVAEFETARQYFLS
jgi:hypothetical protein